MGRIGTDARQHLRELLERDPELQAEYDRLAPRYDLVASSSTLQKGEPHPARTWRTRRRLQERHYAVSSQASTLPASRPHRK